MAESDGIDEAAEQMLRVALMAAAQLAERLAHARAQAAREAQARSDRDAREHTARVEAEHRAARAQRTLTRDPRWWGTAAAPDIVDAYATARLWADHDPAAARITQRVQERYGTAPAPDPTGPSSTVPTSSAGRGLGERAAEREATALLAADAHADMATRTRAWLAEHAHDLPPALTRAEAGEAVAALLTANLGHGRPATEATALRPPHVPAVGRPRTANLVAEIDAPRS